MKIFKAITILNDQRNVLISKEGDRFQKYNDEQIMVTFNTEDIKEESYTTSSSIKNEDFIKKYGDTKFKQELQWYQKENLELPRLCKVKEALWNDEKIVMLNYFNGTMFNTGFGESYIPSYHTTVIPLTNKEIENLKR